MVGKGYVPDRGDVVKVSFQPPERGTSREGIGPSPVLSPREYNSRTACSSAARSQPARRDTRQKNHPGRVGSDRGDPVDQIRTSIGGHERRVRMYPATRSDRWGAGQAPCSARPRPDEGDEIEAPDNPDEI